MKIARSQINKNRHLLLFICCLLLATTCHDSLGSYHREDPNEITISPPGVGYLRLNLQNMSRAIIPTLPPLDDFNKIKIIITFASKDNIGSPTFEAEYTGDIVPVPTGSWIIVVSVFDTDGNLIGAGDEEAEITQDVTTTVTVLISPMEEGAGSFEWKIKWPENITAAGEIKIYNLPLTETEAAKDTINNTDNNKLGSFKELKSGYYFVTVNITNNETKQTAGLTTVILIKDNLTTTLEHEFTDRNFFTNITDLGTLAVTITHETGEGFWVNATLTAVVSIPAGTPVYQWWRISAAGATVLGNGKNYNPAAGDYLEEIEVRVSVAGYNGFIPSDKEKIDKIAIYTTQQMLLVGRGGAGYPSNGDYILRSDIDLSGNNWTPIPNFSGEFDGGGNTIENLTINRPDTNEQGLFGRILSGGTVKNIGLVGANITGGNQTASIAGVIQGKIENCYNTGNVRGAINVGGITGLSDGGTIINCYNTGNITGSGTDTNYGVGGILGQLNTTGGTVSNCYNTGNVTSESTQRAGGIVGNKVNGTVQNCLSIGLSVSTSGTNLARVYGDSTANGTNNYAWDLMLVKGELKPSTDPASVDGADVDKENLKKQDIWKNTATNTPSGAGFEFRANQEPCLHDDDDDSCSCPPADKNPWYWDDTGINAPSLFGEDNPWPDHLTTGDVDIDLILWYEEDSRIIDTSKSASLPISIDRDETATNKSFTVEVANVYESVIWYIDGKETNINASGFSITVEPNIHNLKGGAHNLDVVVYREGTPFTKRIPFSVVPTVTLINESIPGGIAGIKSYDADTTVKKDDIESEFSESVSPPNSLYKFVNWTASPTVTWTNDEFKMPNYDVTLTANFAPLGVTDTSAPGTKKLVVDAANVGDIYTATPLESIKSRLTVKLNLENNNERILRPDEYTLTADPFPLEADKDTKFTVSFGQLTDDFTVKISDAPQYGISLSHSGIHTISAVYGTTPPAVNVTVTNTGFEATGSLTASLSGTNQNDFNNGATTINISDIPIGGSNTFTVRPNANLSVKTTPAYYEAKVSVSGTNITTAVEFTIQFTVTKANPVVTWPTRAAAFVGDTRNQIQTIGESNTTPGSFAWASPNSTLSATSGTYITLYFNPTDNTNYNQIFQNILVRVIPKDSIKMVYIGVGSSVSAAINNLYAQASGVIKAPADSTGSGEDNGDLNDGVSGDYAYLGYTRITTDPLEDPITDIIISSTNQDTLYYSGRTYYRIRNVPVGSKKLTLYYPKSTSPTPSIDLYVTSGGKNKEPPNWTGNRVSNNGSPQDLREGIGGNYNYIWMRR